MSNFDFDSQKEGFYFQNALALLEASELAYESKEKIIDKVRNEWGFDDCDYIEELETQGFVAKGKDFIILSFRGTEQGKIADILTDLFAWRTKIFWGSVHAGFYSALNVAFEKIVSSLRRMQDNHQSIWITGHSLGGALATLAAARLVNDKVTENIRGIYTYGQPLVGDGEFKKKISEVFAGKLYRTTNFLDPVSVVPLKCWKYHHVGEIILFDEDGRRVNGSNLWVRVSLLYISLITALLAFVNKKKDFFVKQLSDLIAPHSLNRYRKNITKNI